MGSTTAAELGERLAKLRKAANLTQAEAAERVGVSAETLSRLERGTQWTDFQVFAHLAEVYGVDFGDLFSVVPAGRGAESRRVLQAIVDQLRPQRLEVLRVAQRVVSALVSGS